MQRSLVDSLLMRDAMLLRLQMVDKLILPWEASTGDAARAAVEVALEAEGCSMSVGHVASQVSFAGVMPEAALVWTVMALFAIVKAVQTLVKKSPLPCLGDCVNLASSSGPLKRDYSSQEILEEKCILRKVRWRVSRWLEWHD